MIAKLPDNEQGKSIPKAKPIVTVGLASDYLTKSIDEFLDCQDPRNTLFQIVVAGYHPSNFAGISHLETPEHKVLIHELEGDIADTPPLDLIIAGSTRELEKSVSSLKGSGRLIARYSMFYGGKSKYTGNSAAEGGYAFDIPKTPGAAFALVQHDKFLHALKMRSVSRIEEALKDINRGHEGAPILRTAHLDNVLIGSGGL